MRRKLPDGPLIDPPGNAREVPIPDAPLALYDREQHWRMDPVIWRQILYGCYLNLPESRIAAMAGVSPGTLRKWRQRGQLVAEGHADEHGGYEYRGRVSAWDEVLADLYLQMEVMRANWYVRKHATIEAAAEQDVSVAIEVLRMRDPMEYSRRPAPEAPGRLGNEAPPPLVISTRKSKHED